MNVYDFTVKTRKGEEVNLADYKGKVLLIVNTATGCGFTPQYKELQEIYDAHKADGLEILDFPCNQFADQAPGTDEEIHTFCTGRFGITFPQFAKCDVNGRPDALRRRQKDGQGLQEQRQHQVELHQVPDRPRGQHRRAH